MALAQVQPESVSVDDYLRMEDTSDIRHELIDGAMYAMTGVSRTHQHVTSNLLRSFLNRVSGEDCNVYYESLKLRVGQDFFYPDIMLVCEDESSELYVTQPRLIVEVLSRSTRRRDQVTKRNRYQSIPSLQEYVLIEQDIVDIEVCRRRESWRSTRYYLGDTVEFESLDLSMTVADIYERVDNEDMRQWLEEQVER